jgi:hypothetical protein
MTEADKFWSWFLANREQIERLFVSDPPAAVRMIEKPFRGAAPKLVFEISPQAKPKEFIVSADGYAERFEEVFAFTRAAPEIPGWKVIAFRQPDDLAIADYRGAHVDRKSVFVEAGLGPEGFVDLILYVPYSSGTDASAIEGATILLLDSCLGEYVAAKRIRHVNFVDVARKPNAALPLDSLRKYFADHETQIKDYK